jgi:hypothetical protein
MPIRPEDVYFNMWVWMDSHKVKVAEERMSRDAIGRHVAYNNYTQLTGTMPNKRRVSMVYISPNIKFSTKAEFEQVRASLTFGDDIDTVIITKKPTAEVLTWKNTINALSTWFVVGVHDREDRSTYVRVADKAATLKKYHITDVKALPKLPAFSADAFFNNLRPGDLIECDESSEDISNRVILMLVI